MSIRWLLFFGGKVLKLHEFKINVWLGKYLVRVGPASIDEVRLSVFIKLRFRFLSFNPLCIDLIFLGILVLFLLNLSKRSLCTNTDYVIGILIIVFNWAKISLRLTGLDGICRFNWLWLTLGMNTIRFAFLVVSFSTNFKNWSIMVDCLVIWKQNLIIMNLLLIVILGSMLLYFSI